jgi:lysine N6-hydroxylase
MTDSNTYDVVGVGLGPFNLSLAALADPLDNLSARFLESKPAWSWHPGLLLDDAMLQVPFLADLVTLVDPTSRWSFLNYLREHDRMFAFYFAERMHVLRREYDDYCRWVSERLPSCTFGASVTSVRWDGAFEVEYVTADGTESVRARNVVLGVGTQPVLPEAFTPVVGRGVFHSGDYLQRQAELAGAADVTVVGSGQSGAEVFLDLLRHLPTGRQLRWLTQAPAFAPMEYSKLGLEHFTPAYTSYFRELPERVRDRLVPAQWQLYKAISAETIAAIYDLLYERSVGGASPQATLVPNVAVVASRRSGEGVELRCQQPELAQEFVVRTDAVVLATGYAARHPDFLDDSLLDLDTAGRYRVDGDYRVATTPDVTGGLYVQNAELHTHGVGTPDLGLGAHRAAVILNAIAGTMRYRLPERTAFTTFGVPPSTDQPEDQEAARVAARTR